MLTFYTRYIRNILQLHFIHLRVQLYFFRGIVQLDLLIMMDHSNQMPKGLKYLPSLIFTPKLSIRMIDDNTYVHTYVSLVATATARATVLLVRMLHLIKLTS